VTNPTPIPSLPCTRRPAGRGGDRDARATLSESPPPVAGRTTGRRHLYDDDAHGYATQPAADRRPRQYARRTFARHAGIDLFLGREARGRGLGPDAIRTLARYLFEERGHHRLTIDPAAANDRAIRAYERVGFRPVGVMRQYERGGDGEFHDGLLLDMLRGELT
jgi:RimJ/RimL family protein N-acetyltransferase